MTDDDPETNETRIEWSDVERNTPIDNKSSKIDEAVAEYRRGYAEFGEFDTAVCAEVTITERQYNEGERVVFTWMTPDGEKTDVDFRLPLEIGELETYLSEHEAGEPSKMLGVKHPCVRGKENWHLWRDTSVQGSSWIRASMSHLMWIPGFVISLLVLGISSPLLFAQGGWILYVILLLIVLLLFYTFATVKVAE